MAVTPGDVAHSLDGLIRSERQIDILNLSGGEPTLNPHFRDIVEECLSRPEIIRLSVSTNGLLLLDDPALLEFLVERRVVVSLQFDGLHDDAYVKLRGRFLLREKLRLIDQASRLDAPMSLTVTVARGVNDRHAHEVLPLLFSRDNVSSVTFQPLAYVGPAALTPDSEKALAAAKRLLASIESCPACDVPSRVPASERSMKSIFIHHFMDRHTFDLARARKCCNVYPLPDGRLIPACVHNSLTR